jgi:hypothetical protein
MEEPEEQQCTVVFALIVTESDGGRGEGGDNWYRPRYVQSGEWGDASPPTLQL